MGHSINEVVSSPYRTDTQATFGLKTEFEQFTRPLHNDQVQHKDAIMWKPLTCLISDIPLKFK